MRKLLALTAVLTLACCASAQAASPAQRAYRIAMKMYKHERAVTTAQLNAGVATVQSALNPCLPTLAADFKNPAVDQSALQALLTELGEQYVGVGGKAVFAPELTGLNALARLPLPKSARGSIHTLTAALTTILSLNTCADLTAWQAASFAPSSEPAGTKASAALANFSVKPIPQVFKISLAEHKRLKANEKKALHALRANLTYVAGTLQPWLNAHGGS